MKKNIIKYISFISGILVLAILYLSVIGVETEKFNKQIKNKIIQTNNNLKVKLNKTKLILDPFNLKINAKTIGTKLTYKGKNLELEYIKTQISLISLIKSKLVSTNLQISTKAIPLKDLVTFARAIKSNPQILILEQAIKKGQVIANLELNFDENGKIKQDYKINGSLNDGKIGLFKIYNFKNISLLFNIEKNVFKFRDINFTTNKTDFISDDLRITQNKKNFFFEGKIQNKNSILNNDLLNLIKLNFKDISLLNTTFSSNNIFSFSVDNRFKIKNLAVDSEITINEAEYKKTALFNDYFDGVNDSIYIRDHKIKATFKNDYFTLKGNGKIKLEKFFDEITYSFKRNKKDFNLVSNLTLSEIKLKNQEYLKTFFPKINETINLQNQKIKINYSKDNLSLKSVGKIKLEKKFDQIDFYISKKDNKFNFDIQTDLNKTLLKIDYLNFMTNNKLNTKLKIIGNYEIDNKLNFKEISILEKENKIVLKNILLDKKGKIIKADKVDLNYLDTENKKNQLLLQRKQKNNYVVSGSIFNANKLITDSLKGNSDINSKIFKNDINLILNIREVYIDDTSIINSLKGHITIKDNKIYDSNISAYFNNKKNLTFSVKTNNNEKVTTFYSSTAESFVKRYKFIKGFEEGDLNFYSTKKNSISHSVLKIDNFKVQEVPILAKLLSFASLQGVADLLTGEGIRFTDFEMDFSNNNKLMTIDELYAIGPSISILMDGYIQSNDLISLRGTLVPATTINRTIASIPLVGNLLIGKKVGEGVFGVSFKIKGPPKDLKTTVNPIKTLTPRFITRTLEKIKKN